MANDKLDKILKDTKTTKKDPTLTDAITTLFGKSAVLYNVIVETQMVEITSPDKDGKYSVSQYSWEFIEKIHDEIVLLRDGKK